MPKLLEFRRVLFRSTHPESVDHEVCDSDASVATRNTLEMNNVLVRKHELIRVLDHHEALVRGYLARERAQQRALTRAGGARDEDVAPRDDDPRKQLGRRTRKRTRGFP